MKLYFAGKIAAGDWRHTIVKELRAMSSANVQERNGDDLLVLPKKWPVMRNVIFGEHSYTGPYFIGDDHTR